MPLTNDNFNRVGTDLGETDTGQTWVIEYGEWATNTTTEGQAYPTNTLGYQDGLTHYAAATVPGDLYGTITATVKWHPVYVGGWTERHLRLLIAWADDDNHAYLDCYPDALQQRWAVLKTVVGGQVSQTETSLNPVDSWDENTVTVTRTPSRIIAVVGSDTFELQLTENEIAALGTRVGIAWYEGRNYAVSTEWAGGIPVGGLGEWQVNRSFLQFAWTPTTTGRPALHHRRLDGLRGPRYARAARTRQVTGWVRAPL